MPCAAIWCRTVLSDSHGVDYVPIEVHVFYYSSVQLVIFLQNRKQLISLWCLITQRCRSLLRIYSRVIKETKRSFYFREE